MKKFFFIVFLIFFYYSNHSFAAEACEWIFSEGYYQEYLDDLPPSDFHSAFYIVVGTNNDGNKDCTYAWRWDSSDRPLTDVTGKAKADCDKYKLEFKIEGECRPYDINKEIVWEGSISVVSNKSGCIQGNCENGQGTLVWDNGDKYVGEFKDGVGNGQGTLEWSNGNKYIGLLKDGRKHGEGTQEWSNRDKYVGEWKNGSMHGQGTYTFHSGNEYIGLWKDGRKHGEGTWILANGCIENGIYEDDRLVTEKQC